MGEYWLEQERIGIEMKLPIQSLLSMSLKEEADIHSELHIEAVIGENKQKEVLEYNWLGTKILVTLHGEETVCLFCGRLDKLKLIKENRGMIVQLEAKALTISLDREKKSRSFQNPDMSYKQIVEEIAGNYSFLSSRGSKKEEEIIRVPIIQYEETDWSFLKRLSSHFCCSLVGRSNSSGVMLSFGMEKERQRELKEEEITGWGIDQSYYENGCYEAGLPIGYARYFTVKTRDNWELGDYAVYEKIPYSVFEKQAVYERGELKFTYRMGVEGLFYRKKYANPLLAGVSLEGTVRRVEGETVYIQLDMDTEEKADYPWEWAPQTNNLSYCMPEADTKISLHFSTSEEASGQAILGKFDRNQSKYNRLQNREFTTLHQKKFGLYPEKLFLEGRDKNVNLTMEDASGIQINSKMGISFQAAGTIRWEGKQIAVTSPVEVVCKTPVSNIELCRDINLFAPGGVQTIGTGEIRGKEKKIEASKRADTGLVNQTGGWQATYSALAAVPDVDFSQNKEADCAIDLIICASIPRIGGGRAVYAMAQVMEGKNESECAFPQVFKSMDNYTVKGGYLLPKEAETDEETMKEI